MSLKLLIAMMVGLTICNAAVAAGSQASQIKPATRFPTGMESAPQPDDSEPSRKAAIDRIKSRKRSDVCPGAGKSVVHHLGTPCGTREFDAPPILETPKLQWVTKPGWWGAWAFSIFDDKIFSFGCERTGRGLAAFELKTGKRTWLKPELCDKRLESKPFRVSDSSMVIFGGRDAFFIDTRNGRLLSQDNSVLNWHTLDVFDGTFVSTGRKNGENSFLVARSPDLKQTLWKNDSFLSACAKGISDCPLPFFSRFAYFDGMLYVSAPPKEAMESPHRQLHAIDLKTGQTIWVHTDQQPVGESYGRPGIWEMSSDNSPMVADNKVIIRVSARLGNGTAYRALDAKTGREIWTTPFIPRSFSQEWLPHGRFAQDAQSVGIQLVAGDWLVTTVIGGEPGHRELWAFQLKDGSPAWRRDIYESRTRMNLAASAGGVLYLAGSEKVMALEAATGTKLWEYKQADYDDENWMQIYPVDDDPPPRLKQYGEIPWDSRWVIGSDGAFYGTFAAGVFRIR